MMPLFIQNNGNRFRVSYQLTGQKATNFWQLNYLIECTTALIQVDNVEKRNDL